MKIFYWISVLLAALSGLAVLTGGTGVQEGVYGLVSRLIALIFCIGFGFLALGIKKRKVYGWWIGAVFFWLLALGFLLNLHHVIGEEDLFFILWIIVTQVLAAGIAAWIYIKWWKPKFHSYFGVNVTEQDGARNGE